MTKKRFKLKLNTKTGNMFTQSQMIGLAKAMSKTDARIGNWEEIGEPYIIFIVKENYPIFKEQLGSYGIIVEELKDGRN